MFLILFREGQIIHALCYRRHTTMKLQAHQLEWVDNNNARLILSSEKEGENETP